MYRIYMLHTCSVCGEMKIIYHIRIDGNIYVEDGNDAWKVGEKNR